MKINLANYKTKTNTRAMTDKINNNDKINVNTVWHQKWHAHKNWAIRRPQIWTFRCCWNRQTPNREHSGARVVWPLKSQQPTPASNRQRLVKCSSIYKTLTLITTVKKKCAICLFVLVFIAALNGCSQVLFQVGPRCTNQTMFQQNNGQHHLSSMSQP